MPVGGLSTGVVLPYAPGAMSTTRDINARRRIVAFSRERDARIAWLLETHPVTAAMLVQIGWFPNKNKALRRLGRLVRRKRVRLVGTVCQKAGRPENVYCRWTPKVDQLLHEVQITQLCLLLGAEMIFRGPHVRDTAVRPDAEVWINGEAYYLEWDRGTMSYSQVERCRFPKYENCRNLALWVCPTDVRRDGLRSRAARVRDFALFTTAAEALTSPHDAIWVDYSGQRAALPRNRQQRANNSGQKGARSP
jgi:hypothetical protein